MLVLRADSPYYGRDVIFAAARRPPPAATAPGSRSPPGRTRPPGSRRGGIAPDAWMTTKYTNAVYDEDQQRWIPDAEVAETTYTAFTAKPKAKASPPG